MIVAVVVCPHPPLLLRELSGRQDVAADLRAACLAGLATATGSSPDAVVVVGGAEATAAWDPCLPVQVRRFGTTGAREPAGLPLSLGVGRRLLDEAGWTGPVTMQAVAFEAGPEEVTEVAGDVAGAEGRTVLLVLGDGSTRRGDKAPGYVDDRAFGFDEAIVRALGAGDAGALEGLDPVLAHDLMVLGRSSFAVLGSVVRREALDVTAKLLYADDPHGVMYTVALWETVG